MEVSPKRINEKGKMMEFITEHDMQALEGKEYVKTKKITVIFRGLSGSRALKRLQDVIFQNFQKTAGKGEKSEKKGDLTVDDIANMIELTGHSEKVFTEVMEALQNFAIVGEGDQKLKFDIQNEMDIDDIENLYQEVLKHFLLGKITRKMNSIGK